MPSSAPPDAPWDGDVNDAAVEDWTAETSTFDRVRQVVEVTTAPQTAADIADRAHVSVPTARKHLDALAATGHVKTVPAETARKYMRSPQLLAMTRIAAIHRDHTKDEIRTVIRELKRELDDFREQYDVADVDELTITLAPDDEGWNDVARWQQAAENLEIAQAALSLYDYDPDDSQSAMAAVSGTATGQRGALGDASAQSTT
jgi:DNA-binding MarR family transcriptional regulator